MQAKGWGLHSTQWACGPDRSSGRLRQWEFAGWGRIEKGTPVSPACRQGWQRELTSVFLQVIADGTIEHAHEQRLGVQGFLAFLGPPPGWM